MPNQSKHMGSLFYLTNSLRSDYTFIELPKLVIMLSDTLIHKNRRFQALLVLFKQRVLPLVDGAGPGETHAAFLAFALLPEDVELAARPDRFEWIVGLLGLGFHGHCVWSHLFTALCVWFLIRLVLLLPHGFQSSFRGGGGGVV